MTRDEAIHKVTAMTPAYSGASSMWLVDSLAILGLLKFDESKSVDPRVNEAMMASLQLFLGHELTPVVASAVIMNLQKRGFKIVEWIEPR